MDRWAGRTVLISGAYSGIGGGVSKALIKHGMNVVGCARNMEKLIEFSGTLEVSTHNMQIRALPF